MAKILSVLVMCIAFSTATKAENLAWMTPFKHFYVNELESVKECTSHTESVYRVCSDALKNEGNAPYIYHHRTPTDTTVVLFHGLSDSPFFFSSIAPVIHQLGYTVVVALLPGHGKLDADDDMEDGELAQRWTQHVNDVMAFAHAISPNVYIGGFSTGGVLATQYTLDNQQKLNGLMLFSGALALDEKVEGMAGIWGVKLLAKLLDWTYQSEGPNPYKYPSVARHSAFMLMDIIFDVREKMENGKTPNIAIFSAHSEADVTTPIRGVKSLLKVNQGQNFPFFIAKSFDVCHADVVVNQRQIEDINFDASQVDVSEPCNVPKANPKHAEMLQAVVEYLQVTSASDLE